MTFGSGKVDRFVQPKYSSRMNLLECTVLYEPIQGQARHEAGIQCAANAGAGSDS